MPWLKAFYRCTSERHSRGFILNISRYKRRTGVNCLMSGYNVIVSTRVATRKTSVPLLRDGGFFVVVKTIDIFCHNAAYCS